MKLVDILARELKEWPEDALSGGIARALAQDSDGELNTLGAGRNGEISQYHASAWSGAEWTLIGSNYTIADDHSTAIVTRAEWQAAVDARKAESLPAWTGEGLPPVGTNCEFISTRQDNTWLVGTVLAHDLFKGDNVVLFKLQLDCGGIEYHPALEFRQIRTAQQIADDERKAAIELMSEDTKNTSVFGLAIFDSLYRAGYRKQVKA